MRLAGYSDMKHSVRFREHRAGKLLFPDESDVRDQRSEIRLDEPHYCNRDATSLSRRADLQHL
jgi:hypothetical protein